MEAQLTGKKIVILAEDLYEDLELCYPWLRMQEAGADVSVVGPKAGVTYHGKHGYPIQSDAAADTVDGAAVDAVIIPGGYAPDRIRRHADMVEIVRRAHENGKVVAFICHAGWVPISAGILGGRKATSFSAIRDDMVNAGVEWVDEEVVVDGKLISSRMPTDLPAFCRAVITAVSESSE